MLAIQFGDIAFEKEEIFVTYDGLLKLKASRVASLHVLILLFLVYSIEIKKTILSISFFFYSEFI